MSMTPTTFGRRTLFQRAGYGLGGFALAHLLQRDTSPQAAEASHFASRAKSVIYIHMVGGPSHLDLFEPKPELQRREGLDCPRDLFESGKFAFVRDLPKLLGTRDESRYQITPSGESGLPISNMMPHLKGVADELAFIRTMHTDEFNHGPAQMFLLTGFSRFGRPSVGSWLNYGLGTCNQNLPGFVVMITGQVLGA
ncbi:MAG: DUF1501 domain-containing protein, partial [Planctomycetaceae bacterium]